MDAAPPDEKPVSTAPKSVFDLMLSGEIPVVESAGPQREFTVDAPVASTPRSTGLEWAALVFAIIAAPLGLILGIVASVRSSSVRGYVSNLARASVVVGVIFSLLGAGGIVAGLVVSTQAANEASIRSSSEKMCAQLDERPGILDDPAFGWPALASIPAYKAEVAAYVEWWAGLETIAPKGAKADVAAIAEAAESAGTRMSISRVVDHSRDYADLQTAASASLLPEYVTEYCG